MYLVVEKWYFVSFEHHPQLEKLILPLILNVQRLGQGNKFKMN